MSAKDIVEEQCFSTWLRRTREGEGRFAAKDRTPAKASKARRADQPAAQEEQHIAAHPQLRARGLTNSAA